MHTLFLFAILLFCFRSYLLAISCFKRFLQFYWGTVLSGITRNIFCNMASNWHAALICIPKFLVILAVQASSCSLSYLCPDLLLPNRVRIRMLLGMLKYRLGRTILSRRSDLLYRSLQSLHYILSHDPVCSDVSPIVDARHSARTF